MKECSALLLLAISIYFYTIHMPTYTLPENQEDVPLALIGWIDSLPLSDKWQTSFNFKSETLPSSVKLVWHKAPVIHVGDNWQLIVKLKCRQGVCATGSVIKSVNNKLINQSCYRYPIATIRQFLLSKLHTILPHSPTSPWLLALAMGVRNEVHPEDWDILKNTGTNHLMAIAGLHIGMISGFVYLLTSWLWRLSYRGMLFASANAAAATTGFMFALVYSLFSGFEIPAQRACIMAGVLYIALLRRRQISAWRAWWLAMTLVLIFKPIVIFTESFWLSFGTIAIVIYTMRGRTHPSGLWWQHFRIQWVIGLGLTPLALYFFQQTSLVSFFANAIAIPWLGLSILPFCLLATLTVSFSTVLASLFLLLADKSLSLLWCVLTWFAHLPHATWILPIPDNYCLVTTVVAFILFLLPAGLPGRWLGIIWLLPLLCFKQVKPHENEYWVSLLDVGQGLSVVVQTTKHVLVFDAGPRLSASSDAGKNIVIPFLRSQRMKAIDRLVISHPDNDHIGGAGALLNEFNITSVLTSAPEKLPDSSYCLRGYSWVWDGVSFEFLYPSVNELHLDNDSSCVLRINNGRHSVLLTGDIEKAAEYVLLSTVKDKLQADVIVAPHHGSKTSGVPEFIQAVHPRYVLYATGYRNKYHFPHKEVVERYAALGAVQLNTAEVGGVRFEIGEEVRLGRRGATSKVAADIKPSKAREAGGRRAIG